MSRRPVGIIDVGSNSIKLLIAEQSSSGLISSVLFEVEETRIGEGMTGLPPRIEASAIEKGTQAIARLYDIAKTHNLHSLRIVATSAVRDAVNRGVFIESVKATTGLELETLSGDQEARLIGKGLQCDPGLSHLSSYSLLDLGGGSMECILFKDGIVTSANSFNLGAVRLASKFISDRYRALAASEAQAIRDHVAELFADANIQANASPSTVAVLTGGTASILAARQGDFQNRISFAELNAFRMEVSSFSEPERVTQMKVPESRADIFPAATTVLCAALDHLGCNELHFSRYNLRYGLVAEMLEHQ